MTNFWIGVDVTELCDQHLLGLHKELHQEAGTIENHPYGQAILQGHWKLGQASTDIIEQRHTNVVNEMESRGMNHESPLTHQDSTGLHYDLIGLPFKQVNRASLFSRCSDCKPKSSKNMTNGENSG